MTLNNWVQQLGMECAEKSKFGILGSTLFLGWTVAAVTVTRLADIYGRKPSFVITYLVQILALVLIICSQSFAIMLLALFLIGVCAVGRWTITYIYLMEFWTEQSIKRYGAFINTSAAVTLLAGAFTF